jgi:hypothetical protein
MDVDYRLAFELAPVGCAVAQPVDCRLQRSCARCSAGPRELLVGQSFMVLYPSADEYERWARAWRRSSTPRATTPTTAS